MFGRVESGRRSSRKEDSKNGRLFHDIEALGRALSHRRNPPMNRLPSRSVPANSTQPSQSQPPKTKPLGPSWATPNHQDKTRDKAASSIWSWKSLKALSHPRHRRFKCEFLLRVHSIEGLGPEFNKCSLVVRWRRRNRVLETRPTRVFHGIVKFEEALNYECSIYGSRNAGNGSANYEGKLSMISASVVGWPDVNLGKHRIDLTRLLPLSLEELEEEKSSGKWTTSFNLLGKAKGAVLNVSFEFLVLGDDLGRSRSGLSSSNSRQDPISAPKPATLAHERPDHSQLALCRAGSVSSVNYREQGWSRSSHAPSQSVEDVKVLHEVLPSSRSEVSGLADLERAMANLRFEEGELSTCLEDAEAKNEVLNSSDHELKFHSLVDSAKDANGSDCDDSEFTAIEQGIEIAKMDLVRTEEEDKDVPNNILIVEKFESEEAIEGEGMMGLEVEKLKFHSFVDSAKDANGSVCYDAEFTVIEQGIEIAKMDLVKTEGDDKDVPNNILSVEKFESEEAIEGEGMMGLEVEKLDRQPEAYDCNLEDVPIVGDGWLTKESVMEELDSALNDIEVFEEAGLDALNDCQSESHGLLNSMEVKSNYKQDKTVNSLSLIDGTASVASEFLSMLGIEHCPFGLSSESDPESPRERLLKQFEKESLANGSSIFGFNIEAEPVDDHVQFDLGNLCEEFELSSLVHDAEAEHQKEEAVVAAMNNKTRAKMLEDAEAEALMREWGLNEISFESSVYDNVNNGFSSSIDQPPEAEVPFELPPLGEGLGPFLQTKDGGFLRSMNPTLFKNSRSNGRLIMQVSSPVVVPAEMGSGIMDILKCLASVGIEKLSMQANRLMPLEDITGMTVQQVAWETAPALEAYETKRQEHLKNCKPEGVSEVGQDTYSRRKNGKSCSNLTAPSGDLDSEYVSLEDLAPLAMEKIEALSIEGLRIQSGMSDDEVTSNISSQSTGEISSLSGLSAKGSGSCGLDGAAGLQLMVAKSSSEDVDGLMGLSITLEEWMRLDAGIVNEEEEHSSRTSKILAAHHASCTDLSSGVWKGGDRRGKGGSGRKGGLLGNNFTVALMVQLRNPQRDFESVGTPMLALIQVERVFIPPKPKIYRNVSLNGNSEEADDPEPVVVKEEAEAEAVPQFKIT